MVFFSLHFCYLYVIVVKPGSLGLVSSEAKPEDHFLFFHFCLPFSAYLCSDVLFVSCTFLSYLVCRMVKPGCLVLASPEAKKYHFFVFSQIVDIYDISVYISFYLYVV